MIWSLWNSVGEHGPRREAVASCIGRGRSEVLELLRPGMCSPRLLLTSYPAAESEVFLQIREIFFRSNRCQGPCQGRDAPFGQSGVGEAGLQPR